jgi:hypothetical protein
MPLARVERDDTMMVPGYARHIFQCSGCNEVEHRLVFSGETASPPLNPGSPPTELVRPLTEAVPVATAPTKSILSPAFSVLSEAEKDLDESEAMLRRAIEMVRGPARGAQPARSLTADRPSPPAELAGTVQAKKAASRIVHIRHDPSYEAQFAAKDATSGLVVLRHQDRARLRDMCSRLGWQVEDAPGPGQ